MRCCAPFCENTSDNVSTSESTGITFHAVPSEGYLRTAWLRALGTQDHDLPDPAVVCSQHFLDDDFCTTESCVRQIHSHAIPSTVQMCMICLDTGSKLSLMSKHKLEEAYEQLTGLSLFQLCRRGNLKQTLCVLCAQRLINFSRFRDLSLRAHSLMTDLVEQHELNTIQHKELMNCTTAHLKCNLTQTTLGANHCDLYIDHTDEEEQTAAEESVVGDVATVVVKNEGSSDSMSSDDNLEWAQEDYCVSKEEYNTSIKLEEDPLMFHRTGSQRLHCSSSDSLSPPPAAGCAPAVVAPLSARLAANDESKVQATEEAGAILTSEQILETDIDELDKRSAQSGTKIYTDINRFTNCVVQLYDIFKKPKLTVLDKNPSVRTHTGAKPYSCEMCNYKTAHSGNFVSHMRTHTGEKPFSCEICSFKCARKNNLTRHNMTHTGEKPFACKICSYKFAQKNHLLQHMKIHTGEKPFCCDICNYKFSQKHNLVKHMRTHKSSCVK